MRGMRCRQVQANQRLGAVHPMRARQACIYDGLDIGGSVLDLSTGLILERRQQPVCGMPGKLLFSAGKLGSGALPVRCRVYGEWELLRGMHCGDIQGRQWLCAVQLVLAGQVFGGVGRVVSSYMCGVPVAHIFWQWQRLAYQLHL